MWSYQTWWRAGAAKAALMVAVMLGMLAGGAGQASAEDVSDWFGRSFRDTSQVKASRLGGPKSETGSRRSRSKGVQVASLGGYAPSPSFGGSLSGGGRINWVASSGCLDSSLRGVIASVAAQFGSVTVSSTCRSHAHNRRVGGASKSYHLTGSAADFRVHGNAGAAYAYLRSSHGGGLKHYGGGLFHIDTGPRRSF
jgi:hypothetical protein